MTESFAALLDARTMWYVTRATGVVSLVLLTLSVLAGITEVTRWATDRWPRFVTAAVHKNVSLIATSFIALHIVTAVVDGFAPIGWIDTVVPFRSGYRPIWLGLGTVAFDLLLAISLTSLLRHRIGHRTWRVVHWAAYACWPIALVHGLGTGTDTTTTVLFDLDLVCVAVVVLAVWWRVAVSGPHHEKERILAAVMSAAAPLLIAVWAFAGPLQPGWARRSGTPASLLGSTVSAVTPGDTASDDGVTSPAAPASLAFPFDAALAGTVTGTAPDRSGNETVTIDMTLSNGAAGSLQVVLHGRALDDGGVSLRAGTATLTGADGVAFSGTVTTLRDDVIDLALTSPSGTSVALELHVVLDGDRVTGTVHGDGG